MNRRNACVAGLAIAVLLSIGGCTASRPVPTGPIAYGIDAGPEKITKSLFDAKDRTISEEDIKRLLDGEVVLPDTVRVAVFKYASTSINRYYMNWWNDEEYLKTQQQFVDTLSYHLKRSPRVSKVITVPNLIAASNPTLTQLREAAVRLQADVLLVYSVSSDIYLRYRVLAKNQAKAFATCETILLDTRTGMIPHSGIVTREKLVTKAEPDLTDNETRKKAEREATLLCLGESGRAVSAFLSDR